MTVIVMKDTGDIVTDPSLKQIRSGSSAILTFVFSNRQGFYFCWQAVETGLNWQKKA